MFRNRSKVFRMAYVKNIWASWNSSDQECFDDTAVPQKLRIDLLIDAMSIANVYPYYFHPCSCSCETQQWFKRIYAVKARAIFIVDVSTTPCVHLKQLMMKEICRCMHQYFLQCKQTHWHSKINTNRPKIRFTLLLLKRCYLLATLNFSLIISLSLHTAVS